MITTRTHHLHCDPTASLEDGWVVITVSDRLVRQHLTGRHKGTLEHTQLRLVFETSSAALAWLSEATTAVKAAR